LRSRKAAVWRARVLAGVRVQVRLARAEVKAAWARQLVRVAKQSVAEHPQERLAAAPRLEPSVVVLPVRLRVA
jgi:hypothetical protein